MRLGKRGKLLLVLRKPTPRGGAGWSDDDDDEVDDDDSVPVPVRCDSRVRRVMTGSLVPVDTVGVTKDDDASRFASRSSARTRGPAPASIPSVDPVPRRISLPAQLVMGEDASEAFDDEEDDDETEDGVCSD